MNSTATQLAPSTAPGPADRLANLVAILPKLNGRTLKVAVAYLAHANGEGRAWPNTRRIAAETGLHPTHVRSARRELRELNFLWEYMPSRGTRSGRVIVAPHARRGDLCDPLVVREQLAKREQDSADPTPKRSAYADPSPPPSIAAHGPAKADGAPEKALEVIHTDQNGPPRRAVPRPTRTVLVPHQQTNYSADEHTNRAPRSGASPTRSVGPKITPGHLADPDELHALASRFGMLPRGSAARVTAHAIAARARRGDNPCALARWLLDDPARWRDRLNDRDEREALETLRSPTLSVIEGFLNADGFAEKAPEPRSGESSPPGPSSPPCAYSATQEATGLTPQSHA